MSKKYILAVSTLEPRKNYGILFEAWNVVYQRTEESPLLVVVANPGWRNEEELRQLGQLVEAGRVAHLSRVPSHELRTLYSNAHAVVCPSRSEGFDLSGVEAMVCGAPVVASDIQVHRWVYGDAALYFDPYDVASCAQALAGTLTMSKDADHLADLRSKGLARAKLYTREAIAPKWSGLFESLAGRSRTSKGAPAASFLAPATTPAAVG